MARSYHFPASDAGERLDKFVAVCAGLSRTQAQKLILEGHVTVNGVTARSGLKLNHGDEVGVFIPSPPQTPLTPEAIPLTILYEDDDLLVVAKPAGLAVHPAPGHPGHTLVNAVLAHYPRLAEVSDSPRPGIVHRLDKDTSGVMVVAKSRRAEMNLAQQFKGRTVKKTYLVLVKGKLEPERGIIEADIGRDPVNRKRMAIVPAGKAAKTEYQVLRYVGGDTLLEVFPQTGRTHQIRVHLAAIGHPVVGDATYGARSPHLKRQFLHAYRLGFQQPTTGEYLEFTAELSEDLIKALEEMG